MERKAIVKRVAATAVLGGALTLAGTAAASPAGATTSSASHASVLTNITPGHHILLPADNGCCGNAQCTNGSCPTGK